MFPFQNHGNSSIALVCQILRRFSVWDLDRDIVNDQMVEEHMEQYSTAEKISIEKITLEWKLEVDDRWHKLLFFVFSMLS